MKYPFPRETNFIARLSLIFIILLTIGAGSFAMVFTHSPISTGKNLQIPQPIPFSHKHHVQGLGLDCRYCHNTVEKNSQAGYPDTATCLGCHTFVWNQAAMLEPVRKSGENNTPLYWYRVHRLPDYVYFDHSIHIAKGVGCVTCHGEVSQMAVVEKKRSFIMRDCLECHEAPQKHLRPTQEVFNEKWNPENQEALGMTLMKENKVHVQPITNCTACHR